MGLNFYRWADIPLKKQGISSPFDAEVSEIERIKDEFE